MISKNLVSSLSSFFSLTLVLYIQAGIPFSLIVLSESGVVKEFSINICLSKKKLKKEVLSAFISFLLFLPNSQPTSCTRLTIITPKTRLRATCGKRKYAEKVMCGFHASSAIYNSIVKFKMRKERKEK